MEWLIWTQEVQELIPTQEKDLSKGSGVEIGSRSGSKSKRWKSSPHSFSHDGMWLSKSGDSSSGMIGVGIKTDSKMLLKLGNITRVNIDSGIWIGSQI